jgi:hypothetical protein
VKRSDFLKQDQEDEHTPSADLDANSADEQGAGQAPDYGFEYDFVSHAAPERKDLTGEPEGVEAYEFRLFAPAAKESTSEEKTSKKSEAGATVSRITLARSPSPATIALAQEEGRFLRPRPEADYVAKVTPKAKSDYVDSALSATALFDLARTPWPGTALPWRVTHVRAVPKKPKAGATLTSTEHGASSAAGPNAAASVIRKKPNKKRRILIRRRQRLVTNSKGGTGAKAGAKTKDIKRSATGEILDLLPEEREKRTARNREKKLKRRQREREKKAAGGVTTEGVDAGDGDDSND